MEVSVDGTSGGAAKDGDEDEGEGLLGVASAYAEQHELAKI
jgi:hypothetical protein